jgi:hypothetical protein
MLLVGVSTSGARTKLVCVAQHFCGLSARGRELHIAAPPRENIGDSIIGREEKEGRVS